jgi:hypothetical protein
LGSPAVSVALHAPAMNNVESNAMDRIKSPESLVAQLRPIAVGHRVTPSLLGFTGESTAEESGSNAERRPWWTRWLTLEDGLTLVGYI